MNRRGQLLVALALAAAGCQPVDLSAPPNAKVSLQATPTAVPVLGGEAAVVATVLNSSGVPVANGTVVYFFTDLGTIDAKAETQSGSARATLRSTGVSGVATVTALSGNSTAATTTVAIGLQPKLLTLTGSSTTVPAAGGTVAITALVQSESLQPVVGQLVLFSATSPGTMASAGTPVVTDSQGKAGDTLTTTAATTVSATVVGTSLVQSLSITIAASAVTTVSVSANPASLPAAGGQTSITAVVFDAQGLTLAGQTVTFSADVGTVAPATATSNTSGVAKATLTTVDDATVTATAGGVSGTVSVATSSGGTSKLLVLTASRPSLSDLNPSPNPCAVDPANTQLPITIYGFVTDSLGKPVNGVDVTLSVENLSGDANDAKGGFCASTVAAPDPTAVSLTSGSSGAGGFQITYSFDAATLATCPPATGFCTATIVGTSSETASAETTIQIQ